MSFAFSFSGTEYRLTQTGTDANLTGIATAVAAVAAVARSTAYTVGTIRKPPTKNGMWYRCSVAGTTAATAPTYGLTVGSSTVDGTATFIAFREPEIYTMGNVTVYEVPEATLYVTGGTLTIDPRVNMLSAIVNIYPTSGGTLNCGVQFTSTYGGGTLYSQGVAIQFSGILYQSSGTTFNLRGATMHSTKTTQAVHEFYGTTYVRNGIWLGQISNNSRLRLNSAAFDVDGFYVYGTQCDTLMTPTAATIIKNVRSANVGVGIDNALSGGAGIATEFVFDGVPSTIGNVSTGYSNWTGLNNLQFINCEAGSLEMVMPDNCGNTGTSGFGGRIYQRYQITAQNTSSVAIQNAITYLKDTNNGKRKIKNVRNATPLDNTADQVQILTTDATGKTPVTQVLTSYIYRNNSVGDIGQPDGNEIRDLRGKIDTAGSDLFDVTLFEYNYAITPIVDIAMKGLSNVATGAKMLADTNVTLSKAAAATKLASSFTVNPTTKVVTVTANSTYDDLYDILKSYKCTAAQTNLETPTLTELIVTPSGTQLTAYTGWTLAVNTGVTLASGTKFNFVRFDTITLSGSGQITGVYASTAGTSTTWQFQGVQVGSSIVVYDGSGTTKLFQGSVTTAGTYSLYIAPGTTGTYYWAVEKYGKQRESGSFAANTGGLLYYTPLYVEDVGISQTTQATVAAYTAIDTLDKFYDYTAYRRLSEDFIKIGQIATRSGASVDIGNYNLKVNSAASVMESITSATITIKSGSLAAGSKYTTIIATPPKTVTAQTTEVITASIEDGNGDSSVTIQGGSGDFTLWKITNATPEEDYATGTNLGDVGNVTYRFLHVDGYKIVIVDNVTGYRIPVSMSKGVYTRGLFFGDQVQLAQNAEVTQINTKVDILTNDVIAVQTSVDAVQTSIDTLPSDILNSTVETGATVVESFRLANSVLGGKVSGAQSGVETFRDLSDSTDRVISTVDSSGNRTVESYNLT